MVARVVDPDVADGSADVVGEPDYLRPPTASPKRPEPSAPKRPRPNRRAALVLAIAAIVLGVAITVFPYYLITSATKDADRCFSSIAQAGKGTPHQCLPPAWVLDFSERLPWFEGDALALRASTRARATRLAYALATAAHPDRQARAEAAERVHELAQIPGLLASAPSYDSLAGAFAELTRFGIPSDDKTLRRQAFSAARAIADVEALGKLAQGGDPSDAPELNLERGATACLLGNPDAGRQMLTAADVAHRDKSPDSAGFDAARLALFACSKRASAVDARNVSPASLPALVALEASRGRVAGLDRARTLLLEPDQKPRLRPQQRLRLAARIVAAEPPSLRDSLTLFAPSHGPIARLEPSPYVTPWSLLAHRLPDEVSPSPSAAIAAADHLQQLRQSRDEDADPLECRAEPCPAPVALDNPEALLTELVVALRLDAATELARRGQAKDALTQARVAFEASPLPRRHRIAPLLLWLGDAEGALAAYRTAPDEAASQLGQALALAHLGRFDEATTAAEDGFAAAGKAEREGTAARVADREPAGVVALGWTWAAMALKTGKAAHAADVLAGTGDAELAAIAEWLEVATMPEPHRIAQRYDLVVPELTPSVLPAIVHVISQAVPTDSDVPVWLDRVLDVHQRAHPLPLWLARAEAARWRDDPSAADAATAHATALQALPTTDAEALLAALAQLR
jgi:hypothetical protein